jgi:hypothetical protein
MKGLLHRNVFYELVAMAKEVERQGKATFIIVSQGVEFVLGTLA